MALVLKMSILSVTFDEFLALTIFVLTLFYHCFQNPPPYYENYAYQPENLTAPNPANGFYVGQQYTSPYYPATVPHYVPRVCTRPSAPATTVVHPISSPRKICTASKHFIKTVKIIFNVIISVCR